MVVFAYLSRSSNLGYNKIMEKMPVVKNNYQEDIVKIDNFKIKDKLGFKIKECSIIFEYSYPNINVLFKSLLGKPGYVAGIKNGIINIIKNLRKIDNLSLKNDKSEYFIYNILPKDWTVLFSIGKKEDFESCISFNDKTIILNTNPLTKEGLMGLLHEIGHWEDDKKISKYDRFQREKSQHKMAFRNGTEKDKDILIQIERNAWANGLNHIRNFKDDLDISIDEIKQEVHGNCLQYYEDRFTELLNKH